MDNNINNPEIIPAAPEAEAPAIELPETVIPEINTIDPINTIEEAAPAEAAVAVKASEAVAATADAAVVPAGFSNQTPATVIEPTGDIAAQAYNAGVMAASAGTAAAVAADAPKKGDGAALVGFILGLSALTMTWNAPVCYLCIPVAIAGIVFSAVAKKKGVVGGFQKAGITLSILGLVFSCIASLSCATCGEAMTSEFEGYEDVDMTEIEQYMEEYMDEYMQEYDFQGLENFEYEW